jgi:hypothetical protein
MSPEMIGLLKEGGPLVVFTVFWFVAIKPQLEAFRQEIRDLRDAITKRHEESDRKQAAIEDRLELHWRHIAVLHGQGRHHADPASTARLAALDTP